MRAYEATYILDPALSEEDQTALIERFQELVKSLGAEVEAVSKWEKRRLAYEVNGRREGIYVIMNFKAELPVKAELDRVLKLSEGVIRHIIVRTDEG
ncbi:MAG: 30S ribosomal protein S6 [Armatimonadetes bacterium]|nr:30S ribosomal protein S6 [Armatimonadota bacterium]